MTEEDYDLSALRVLLGKIAADQYDQDTADQEQNDTAAAAIMLGITTDQNEDETA